MKMNVFKYSAGIACVVLASLTTSCNELDLAPTNKFTELNYWTSEAKASAVLSQAYSQMMNSSKYFSDERLSDNLYEGRGSTDEKKITSGQVTTALGRFSTEWSDAYKGIKTCHTLLENIDQIDMNESDKEVAESNSKCNITKYF